MKNSQNAGNTVLRLTLLVIAATLAGCMATGCGPQATQSPMMSMSPQPSQAPRPQQAQPAPQSSPVGQWHTTLQGISLTISIEANGQYLQEGVPPNGGTKTAQGGPYQLVAPNTIIFTVTGYSPMTRMIYVPNPTCGVPGVPSPTNPRRDSCLQWQEETMPHPPGSRYAYVFNGPNQMTLNNEQAQESITFTRVK